MELGFYTSVHFLFKFKFLLNTFSFEQTRISQKSIFRKKNIFRVVTFFFIFGPSFRSIHQRMPKIAIFSEGIFKMSWMKTFNRQRRKISDDRAKKNFMKIFLMKMNCDCWGGLNSWTRKPWKMDKENEISGSLDCVFKVPMDPNSIKSQEQFFFYKIMDLTVASPWNHISWPYRYNINLYLCNILS